MVFIVQEIRNGMKTWNGFHIEIGTHGVWKKDMFAELNNQ